MVEVTNLEWLQDWYKSQCDGDWEHEYGIRIETVDNPGWYVVVNLKGTEYENKQFISINVDNNQMDWYFCLIRDANFEASCSPCNLSKILQIFRQWVEKV